MTVLKSIVVGLVLANMGYFLWSRGIASTREAVVAVPTLKLASEVPASVASSTATPPADAATPGLPADSVANAGNAGPALGDSPKHCSSVGPFREVSEAARAAGTLRSKGYDPRQRVADGEVWAGVWVYLPVPPEPAAATQILGQLKAGGIDDAMEMPGPNDSSVISLGLFSEPKRAQARVAQAQALSLNATVADRKRNGNVYWIDIDLKPTDPMLNPADLQADASHITRIEVKSCPPPGAQR